MVRLLLALLLIVCFAAPSWAATNAPKPKHKPVAAHTQTTAPQKASTAPIKTTPVTNTAPETKFPFPKRKPNVVHAKPKPSTPATDMPDVAPIRPNDHVLGTLNEEPGEETGEFQSLIPDGRTAGLRRSAAPSHAPRSGSYPILTERRNHTFNQSTGMPDVAIVFFKENSADLESGQSDVIDSDVIGILKNNDDLGVNIEAFSEGSTELSERRAQAMGDYLARHGVSGERIRLQGSGSNTRIEPRDRAEFSFGRM